MDNQNFDGLCLLRMDKDRFLQTPFWGWGAVTRRRCLTECDTLKCAAMTVLYAGLEPWLVSMLEHQRSSGIMDLSCPQPRQESVLVQKPYPQGTAPLEQRCLQTNVITSA